jgi:hypothetical protein
MVGNRKELLAETHRLLGQLDKYRKLTANAHSACSTCLPAAESKLIEKAQEQHEEALRRAGITWKVVLLRGSALHLPFLRRLVHHYGFPYKECEVCQQQKQIFENALEAKKFPNDVDLITVGIPQDRASDFIALTKELKHDPESVVDLTAHLTSLQVHDPRHTYSSFFNMERLKLPAHNEDVNPIKRARHFASMLFFLHAYPALVSKQKEGKPVSYMDEARGKFVRHLKNLSADELEEVNKVLAWHWQKESHILFHLGEPKENRRFTISSFNLAVRQNMKDLTNELFFHLQGLHTYNKEHARKR